jgi:SAM-dependent methyltransferase
LPLADAAIDVVLSGQMLEHCELFWLTFGEMIRVLRPDGYLFLIAPSAGPIHRYPVDCYRFYPDAYAALAKFAGCHLVTCWLDERGPWRDLVGVFRRTPPSSESAASPRAAATAFRPAPTAVAPRSPEVEVTKGQAPYLDVLAGIHARLSPSLYLEIGVRRGRSLALSRCASVGVDPDPDIEGSLRDDVLLFTSTSDDFFERDAASALPRAIDMALIDGMHRFEYSLRDFMNIERRAAPSGIIVADDIYPNHPLQALRNRETQVWSGDVWKLHACLREHRPDLLLIPLDASPCGLLVVAGLDPDNRLLWDRYNPIVRQYVEDESPPPPRVLLRSDAQPCDSARLLTALTLLRAARAEGLGRDAIHRRLQSAGIVEAV